MVFPLRIHDVFRRGWLVFNFAQQVRERSRVTRM
jgi:hypothetical protein